MSLKLFSSLKYKNNISHHDCVAITRVYQTKVSENKLFATSVLLFQAFGNLSHCQKYCLQIMLTFLIKYL